MCTSGSPVGVGHRLVEELPALGVVGGHRADQRELDLGHLLLDQPVGVDHAHRVLPGVEARHLAHAAAGPRRCRTGRTRRRRPRARRPCSSATAGRSPAGRCGPARRPGPRARSPAGGRPRRRRRAPAAPGARSPSGWAWRGRCGSARSSACPSRARAGRIAAGWGSWMMITSQPSVSSPAFISLYLAKTCHSSGDRPWGLPWSALCMQLGDVVELLAAEHHLPLGVDADVVHQRDQRVEDLRDPAAERRGGEVQDLQPLELGGQLADLLDQRLARHVRVVGQALVADRDRLQHQASSLDHHEGA